MSPEGFRQSSTLSGMWRTSARFILDYICIHYSILGRIVHFYDNDQKVKFTNCKISLKTVFTLKRLRHKTASWRRKKVLGLNTMQSLLVLKNLTGSSDALLYSNCFFCKFEVKTFRKNNVLEFSSKLMRHSNICCPFHWLRSCFSLVGVTYWSILRFSKDRFQIVLTPGRMLCSFMEELSSKY